MKKFLKYSVLILLVSFFFGELFFRWYGLHDYPTYREDTHYEYIHHSDQKRLIYRNGFSTNTYGMRSEEVDNKKRKVLLIGDSVINGGNRNSNSDLATTILQKNLGDSVQVLNISSGSWGPDNGMAFLKKHGDFEAELICLIFNSHDAGDTMDFTPVVGLDPIRPETNDPLAIFAFAKRFVFPKLRFSKKRDSEFPILKESPELNPGWNYFYEYCKEK